MREPKDLCVSYYFYLKMAHNFKIDFEDFCELFMNDALPLGSVFHHYLDFWNKRHEPNYLILRYEEMLANPRKAIKIIASHLNKSLNEEDIDAICQFVAFKNMKQNKSCNLEVSLKSKVFGCMPNGFYYRFWWTTRKEKTITKKRIVTLSGKDKWVTTRIICQRK